MTLDTKAERAICDAATPGPWIHDTDNGMVGSVVLADGSAVAQADPLRALVRTPEQRSQRDRNAAFIARARTGYPAALDEIDRLRAENADLRAETDDLRARLKRAEDLLPSFAERRDKHLAKRRYERTQEGLGVAFRTCHAELSAALSAPTGAKEQP